MRFLTAVGAGALGTYYLQGIGVPAIAPLIFRFLDFLFPLAKNGHGSSAIRPALAIGALSALFFVYAVLCSEIIACVVATASGLRWRHRAAAALVIIFALEARDKMDGMELFLKPPQLPKGWGPPMRLQNNVFGRATLEADTACCRYLGKVDSLQACAATADLRPDLATTSITWHRKGKENDGWPSTCYAIVDGTWLPEPVQPGQAEADSARIDGTHRRDLDAGSNSGSEAHRQKHKEQKAAPNPDPPQTAGKAVSSRTNESWPWATSVTAPKCLTVLNVRSGNKCSAQNPNCGAGNDASCGAHIDWFLKNKPAEFDTVRKAARLVATKYKGPCGPCGVGAIGEKPEAIPKAAPKAAPKTAKPEKHEGKETKHSPRPAAAAEPPQWHVSGLVEKEKGPGSAHEEH